MSSLLPPIVALIGVVIGAVITKAIDFITARLKIDDDARVVARRNVAEVLALTGGLISHVEKIGTDLEAPLSRETFDRDQARALFDRAVRELDEKNVEYHRAEYLAVLTTPSGLHGELAANTRAIRAWTAGALTQAEHTIEVAEPSDNEPPLIVSFINDDRRELGQAGRRLQEAAIALMPVGRAPKRGARLSRRP